MPTPEILLSNLDKIHTTPMGIERIKRNLNLQTDNVVDFCKQLVISDEAQIERNGKNWYISVNNCRITINAYSYTIITAHTTRK